MNKVEKMGSGEKMPKVTKELGGFRRQMEEVVGADAMKYCSEKIKKKVRGELIPGMATLIDGIASGEIGEREINVAMRVAPARATVNMMALRMEENAEDERVGDVMKVAGEILGSEVKMEMKDGKVGDEERERMTGVMMGVAEKCGSAEEFQKKLEEIGEGESVGVEFLRATMRYDREFDVRARESFWQLRMMAMRIVGGKIEARSGDGGMGDEGLNAYMRRLEKLKKNIAGAAWTAINLQNEQASMVDVAKGGMSERVIQSNKERESEKLAEARESLEKLDGRQVEEMDMVLARMLEKYPSEFIRGVEEQYSDAAARERDREVEPRDKNDLVAANVVEETEGGEAGSNALTVETLVRKEGENYVVPDELLGSVLKWYNLGVMRLMTEARKEGEERLGKFVERVEQAVEAGIIPEIMAERARKLENGERNVFYHLADRTKPDANKSWAGWIHPGEEVAHMFLEVSTYAGDERLKGHVFTHEFMHLLAGEKLFQGEGMEKENRIFNEAMTEHLATVLDFGKEKVGKFGGMTYFRERATMSMMGRTVEECIGAYAGTGREEFFRGESETEVAQKMRREFQRVSRQESLRKKKEEWKRRTSGLLGF
ncbi:MAG: hypothetical protein Q4F60_01085 [Candidatus Saccharibacteria bacterium]|nr:hypothetical protein [Candidatus Saccharibacteria bacterium]